MSNSEILREFQGCINCSQVVLGQWAEDLGYEREECLRMAAPFGGGCFRGDTCGAVSGAMLAIGLRHGHWETGDAAGKEATREKVAQFQERFIARYGTLDCRTLIGYNFALAGENEKARESGILFERCPDFVNTALEILDEIM